MSKLFDSNRAKILIEMLAPERRTVVVEVGANPINDNPYKNLMKLDACDVWGFEPEERAFARLNPGPNETYLPVAVGNGEDGTFHVCQSISLSSLLEPNPETTEFFGRLNSPTKVHQRIPVKTVRLDALEEIPEFDLLKIDVQGGELQVYDGARRKLEKALAVITEVAFVPLYKEQPLLDAQMSFLETCGFDLHKFMFLKAFSLRGGLNSNLNKNGHSNQLLDGDAVFIRTLRHPGKIGDEQLKHMAILAETVFESFDIALRCVEHLVERGCVSSENAIKYSMLLPDQRD